MLVGSFIGIKTGGFGRAGGLTAMEGVMLANAKEKKRKNPTMRDGRFIYNILSNNGYL